RRIEKLGQANRTYRTDVLFAATNGQSCRAGSVLDPPVNYICQPAKPKQSPQQEQGTFNLRRGADLLRDYGRDKRHHEQSRAPRAAVIQIAIDPFPDLAPDAHSLL